MLKAILIGAGRYASPEIPEVTSAARDAAALASVLNDGDETADVLCLIDGEATAETARSKIAEALAGAASNDTVFISYAGHGAPGRRLVLSDTDPHAFDATTLSLDWLADLWRTSAAGRVILVLDCCFSGSASARAWAPDAIEKADQPRLDDLPGQGRIILAAAGTDEQAYDDPSARLGLLTHAVIEAGTDESQSQTLMAIMGRVQDEVSGRAAALMRFQTPVVIGEADADFRLPAMRKGSAYDRLFHERPDFKATGPVSELSGAGVPDDIVAAWATRFENLNRLQIEAVNDYAVLDGQSLLVAAPTSSGKTFLGELAAARAMLAGEKVAYLAPYRAIVTEKGDEFDQLYDETLGFRIRRASGDWRDDALDIRRGRFDLALFTYETFLSLILQQADVLDRLGLIVIDEAHFITDPNRGIVVELIMTALRRARDRGVQPQLIALSAVIGNTNEFEIWAGCRLLRTETRPVPLVEGVLSTDGSFRFVDENGNEGHEQLLPQIRQSGRKPRSKDFLVPLIEELVGARGEKVIVFRASRGEAAGSAKYLAAEAGLSSTGDLVNGLPDEGTSSRSSELRRAISGGAAFHSTDLNREERRFVEDAFKKQDSGVGVLTSTTTLAAGVNLPASTVIITDTQYPTGQAFTVSEYKNMAGRAGRLGQNERGRSILLAMARRDADRLFETYVCGLPEAITSSFDEADLGSWVIKLLAQVRELPESEVIQLILSTFGGFSAQRANPDWSSTMQSRLPTLIGELDARGLVNRNDGHVEITDLGEACGAASFDITSSLALIDLLRDDRGTMNDPFRLACGIQALPALDDIYTPQLRHGEPVHFQNLAVDAPGIDAVLRSRPADHAAMTRRAKRALILCSWLRGDTIEAIEQSLSTNPFNAVRAGDISRVVDTTRFHLVSALAIAAIAVPERANLQGQADGFLRRLDLGLPEDGADLVTEIPALTRVRAMRLLQAGITGAQKVTKELLTRIFGSAAANSILDSDD